MMWFAWMWMSVGALAQEATEPQDTPEVPEEQTVEADDATTGVDADEVATPTTEADAATGGEEEAAETAMAVESIDVEATADAPDTAPEPPPERREAWEKVGLGWGGLPFANYSSDSKFGFGVIGNIYGYDGDTDPYKWTLGFLIYFNTTGGQSHRIDFDMLDVGGLPLRINSRLAFDVVRNDWYCGLGTTNSCPVADAEAAASAAGLTDDAYDTAVRDYYKVRYLRPSGFLNFRYMLSDKPHRLEVMAGWWGEYYLPGDLKFREPYTPSLYGSDFPEGEQGFSSNLQVGLMLDNRDNEPAPMTGYWGEVSIRGASPVWGGTWSYFGYNLTMRTYLSHPKYRKFVWAQRLVHDGIVGNPNTIEMSRAGGSVIYDFFGGQRAGRGVRYAGVNGRVRFLAQEEARWTFLDLQKSKVPFAMTLIGFGDFGVWAENWNTLTSEPRNPLAGFGGGLRLAFNQNFIIRADVGFSQREDYAPGIYLDVGNLF
ncbi:MAG: hypothetical protein ACON5B_18300 [Myxococcota bacterium]